ncbi:MAG: AraC family transcriptional regulator [Rubrivivax sp.]|nr:MAG: AraC family transcriptional regulator [Rubrivivax sp.]
MPFRPGIDRLSPVLERFRVRAHMFHAGPLCGVDSFAAQPGKGFLHVMWRGDMVVTHRPRSGAPRRIQVQEPSLLFYPRPLAHDFHNVPDQASDFTCALLEFEGGAEHPLARALPPVVVLPLAALDGVEQTLALLFKETEQVRCGQRLLADRLFDVLLLQILRWLLNHPAEASLSPGLLLGLAHPQLAKALIAIQERPSEPWTVDSMAQSAGMSRSAFAVAFKEQVGDTPADHLAQWRLSIAQAQLRRGLSIKAIAQDLGYGSASALSRAFAQKVGQSPRDWLASLKAA